MGVMDDIGKKLFQGRRGVSNILKEKCRNEK
jgi:hypothetical protein